MSSRLILRPGRRIPGQLLLALAACASPSSTVDLTDARLTIQRAPQSGDGQAGRAGLPLPDSLRVLVTYEGQPAAGVPIVWSTIQGAIAGQAVTDARGMAAAAWRLPALASTAVQASARLPTRNGGGGVSFHASASFPTLTLIAGGGQRGPVTSTLPVPVRLRATWQGEPIVGDSIRWTVGGFGGQPTMEPLAAVTDAAGEIAVRWTLDYRAGTQIASARLASDGANGPALGVVAEADPGPPARLSWGGANALYGEAWVRGRAGSIGFEAIVNDRFGNPLVGTPVMFRLRDEGGVVFREATTNSVNLGRAWTFLALNASEASRPFRAEAVADGVPPIEAPVELFDLLFVYGPMGDYLEPGTHLTVPAGSVLRWGSIAYDHECRPVDGSGGGGLLQARPRKVLELRYEQPGTFLWECTDSGSVVRIDVTP